MTQLIDTNMFVAAKKKAGFLLPVDVLEELDYLSCGLSGKEKWIVVSAGIMALGRLPVADRNRIYSQIKAADVPGGDMRPLLSARTIAQ
jgi:hypothetical protein